MSNWLTHDIMQRALAASLVASVLVGIVGSYVVVKRLVFIAAGIAHAALAGLGLFFFLGAPPLLGAAAVAITSALGVELAGRNRLARHDAVIGVVWAIGMAIGIVFIAKTPGYAPDLMSYLFGNVLTVNGTDLTLLVVTTVAVVLFATLFHKEMVLIAFDEDLARVQGLPVRALMVVFLSLLGLSVVVLLRIVGMMLVLALIAIPPLLVLQFERRFQRVLGWAVLVAAGMGVGGLFFAYELDLPSGAATVLVGGSALVVAALVATARASRARVRLVSPDPANNEATTK